jgi:hypothetical protein
MRVKTTSILAAAAITITVALGGCTYRAAYPTTGYVELSSAPVDVSGYPRRYYDGRTVYLVDDRWMYPDSNRWVYYQQEPPYLTQQRTYIRQAPPAYPYGYPRGGNYPQGPYRGPAAPPAVRVR